MFPRSRTTAQSRRLAAAGEDVEPFTRLYAYFGGSWARAREALELADREIPRRIEARFRSRQLGKVWRYTDDTLRDVLMRAAAHWGRPPSVAEFEWWREREQRLARSTGDTDPHLPSSSPYCTRWATWEGALLHFGFSAADVASRLEGKTEPHNRNADPYLPAGLPVAELSARATTGAPTDGALALDADQARRLRAAYRELPRRSRYVLTVRLGLGAEPVRTLKAASEPLALSLDRIRQLQLAATDALVDAVSAQQPVSEELRAAVVRSLRMLTAP